MEMEVISLRRFRLITNIIAASLLKISSGKAPSYWVGPD
jgi:hypothetical protein